ncbi:MAG: DUF6320 domain-containing protein [Gemmiger sp.]|uniref:DUF6320 domain-containing protein n=1 Tax=Gemmiger sp. TaxID=2049027 RepID=UPI002E7924F9|nr:DUF6320 domain-containing protein [Gemmiger sp.]MEE0799955.1 DUF6320 domain-containing protein [Gemmiger sp.]
MKSCPHCHVRVGGSTNYCPLCQSPLVPLPGPETPDRYPAVESGHRRASLLYQIFAFVLLAGAAVCIAVDFLLTEGSHLHWSLLVLAFAAAALLLLRALLRRGRNAPRLIFQILVGASLLAVFCDAFLGTVDVSIDYVVPILCCVALVLNFIFSFVNRLFTENALVYLLLNMVIGIVPYIALALHRSARPPLTWWLCMVISVVTFLGLVIFKGRTLWAEFQKRLHL